MVLDNHTAELLVGDQVPVATQSAVSTINPDAPIVNSIEFRDTGVVLRVTPRVNASGLVSLEIEQEVSDVVATTTSGIDSPTIRQRRIRSSVAVQSGQTVALGGLIRDRRTWKSDGVPVLSRVPVLGALFGSKGNAAEKTELLVLITPRAVRNQEEANEVTTELRKRIRSFAPASPAPPPPKLP
jgi:general secretion pathway protein D